MDIKPIRTKVDYQAALAEIKQLLNTRCGTPEGDRLGILTTLLVALSLMALVGCSTAVSDPTSNPVGSVYVTATPASADFKASPVAPGAPATPPPWAGLKLSGHLVYVQIPRQIISLDLASGQQTILFTAPNNGFVSAAQVSPDGKRIVMAYAPPADPALQSINTGLYVIPVDGSAALQVLLQRTGPKDDFFNPVWSADGKYVYYSHLIPDLNSGNKYINFTYDLERVAYPGGQPQKLIERAFWPRLSPDGSQLAYVTFVPGTNSSDLYLADADGSHVRLVMPAGTFFAVDAPLFSRDGQTILFTAVGEPQVSGLSWLDQIMGVRIAEAHNVPSDWWRVSVEGGKPEQLTHVNSTGMYGDFAPDGQHVVFASIKGLFVMQPDGSNLVQVVQGVVGNTVSWIP